MLSSAFLKKLCQNCQSFFEIISHKNRYPGSICNFSFTAPLYSDKCWSNFPLKCHIFLIGNTHRSYCIACAIIRFMPLLVCLEPILPFCIQRATSVPLGKGTKFALHHGKMATTKSRAIQWLLHISTFQFTFKCGYNDFISKYTDINSLHVTQIDLLHNDTSCSTKFAHFRCKKGSLRVNSVMI